jgi:hypothetical protein
MKRLKHFFLWEDPIFASTWPPTSKKMVTVSHVFKPTEKIVSHVSTHCQYLKQ